MNEDVESICGVEFVGEPSTLLEDAIRGFEKSRDPFDSETPESWIALGRIGHLVVGGHWPDNI